MHKHERGRLYVHQIIRITGIQIHLLTYGSSRLLVYFAEDKGRGDKRDVISQVRTV